MASAKQREKMVTWTRFLEVMMETSRYEIHFGRQNIRLAG